MVRSTQGLMTIAPAGRGYPSSRRYMRVASVKPPPALSPAKIYRPTSYEFLSSLKEHEENARYSRAGS